MLCGSTVVHTGASLTVCPSLTATAVSLFFTLLFTSSDPLAVSRVNNRPPGLSILVTGLTGYRRPMWVVGRRGLRLMLGPAFPLSCVPLHPARPDTVTVNYGTECGRESRESSWCCAAMFWVHLGILETRNIFSLDLFQIISPNVLMWN